MFLSHFSGCPSGTKFHVKFLFHFPFPLHDRSFPKRFCNTAIKTHSKKKLFLSENAVIVTTFFKVTFQKLKLPRRQKPQFHNLIIIWHIRMASICRAVCSLLSLIFDGVIVRTMHKRIYNDCVLCVFLYLIILKF